MSEGWRRVTPEDRERMQKAVQAGLAKQCGREWTIAGTTYFCMRDKHEDDVHLLEVSLRDEDIGPYLPPCEITAAARRGAERGCNHQGPFAEGPAAEPQDRERNQLYNAGFEAGLKTGTKRERAAVVAWLRKDNRHARADAVERGEHRREGEG